MRPGGGRQKGNNFELKMARKLSIWWGQPGASSKLAKDLWFRRTPLSGGWGSSITSGDIIQVSKEAQDFPFSCEMKNREEWDWSGLVHRNPGWPVLGYWKQCCEAADKAKLLPLVVFTKNHAPIYFCMNYNIAVQLGLPFVQSSIIGGIVFGLMDDLLSRNKEDVINTCATSLASIRKDDNGSAGPNTKT